MNKKKVTGRKKVKQETIYAKMIAELVDPQWYERIAMELSRRTPAEVAQAGRLTIKGGKRIFPEV